MESDAVDAIVKDIKRNSKYDNDGYIIKDTYDITIEYDAVNPKIVLIKNYPICFAKGRVIKVNMNSNTPKILTISNNRLIRQPHIDFCRSIACICIFFIIMLICNIATEFGLHLIPSVVIPGFCFTFVCLLEKGFFVKKIEHKGFTNINARIINIAKTVKKKNRTLYSYYPIVEYEWLGNKMYGYIHEKLSPDSLLTKNESNITIDSYTGEIVEKKKSYKYIYLIFKLLFIASLIISLYNYFSK
jgi:hypothetical protein